MPDKGLKHLKIRSYLETLSPKARGMIIRAARAAPEGAETIPLDVLMTAVEGLDVEGIDLGGLTPKKPPRVLIAPEASAEIPYAVSRRERIDAAFWAPLDPFLVEVTAVRKQTGRIALSSLERVNLWLSRDAAGAEFAVAYQDDGDTSDAAIAAVADSLRKSVVNRVLGIVRAAEGDPRDMQRLVAQIGDEHVMADLRDMIQVFQNAREIEALMARIPRHVTIHDVSDERGLPARMAEAITTFGLDAGQVGAAILSRSSSPWLLAVLTARMAGTEDARLLAQGRFGAMVDFLLAEMDRFVALAAHCEKDRLARPRLAQVVRDFHDIHRHTLQVLDLDEVAGWRKHLGATRKDMSELLARPIESAAGLVRRALRVESQSGFSGAFDADALDDAEFALKIYAEARLAADSLALNEVLTRVRKDIERTLELLTEKLLSDLKGKGSHDRKSLLLAIDGAIRLCRIVFGEDYANLLQKNRDLALRPKDKAG